MFETSRDRLLVRFFSFILEAEGEGVPVQSPGPPQCILTCNDTCLAAHADAVLCLRATPQIWPTPAASLLVHGPRVDLGLKKGVGSS